MRPFISINPFTEEKLAEFPFTTKQECDDLIRTAHEAYLQWKDLSFTERGTYVFKLAGLLKENADMLARLASVEMGKLYAHAHGELLKSATLCEYYATHSEGLLQPSITHVDETLDVKISYEPMGVVLGIFPWNFPYWQILRSAIPTIMSGNTILVKPAPNVPQCSKELQLLIEQCGFPKGIYQTLFADDQMIADIIADNRITATTLTGSEAAGAAVGAQSGKYIKPNVLELGGSDPLIVLNDANLDAIMEQVVFARYQNNGQSCVAAKRFIIHSQVADAFIARLVSESEKLLMGDPLLEGTTMGPLARLDLAQLLKAQVDESVSMGAKILFQAAQKPAKGYFYPPTIITNIPRQSRAYQEELFGPVISLYTFNTDDEAIALANDTRFGLGASIYTTNIERGERMASQIEAGMVYINQLVKSDVRFPFGGIKKSGHGRELGAFGLKSFCNAKSIWIKKS